MKHGLAFLVLGCTLFSTAIAVLTCYCGDAPLVTDRYKQCCDQVHGTTNATTGACNIPSSNGNNEEKFLACCKGPLDSVNKALLPGGPDSSRLKVVNKIEQINGRCDEQ